MRKTAGSLVLILCLSGCAGGPLKAVGFAPWPLYRQTFDVPPLTSQEKSQIKDALPAALVARLKAKVSEGEYYKAIVLRHNDKAMDEREKTQKYLGDSEDLEAMRASWKARIKPVGAPDEKAP